MKIVGWNIFIEKENEDGEIELVAWDISNWLANEIEEEFSEYMAKEEGLEEE